MEYFYHLRAGQTLVAYGGGAHVRLNTELALAFLRRTFHRLKQATMPYLI